MRRPLLPWGPVLAAGIGLAAAAPDDEVTALARIRPTHIAWGEIATIEGGSITLALPEPTQFGRTLALSLTRFTRVEDLEPSGRSETATRETRVGEIRIAIELADDRSDWRPFRDGLDDALANLTPDGFERFASEFTELLSRVTSGADFDALVCKGTSDRPGDQATRISERTDEKGAKSVHSSSGGESSTASAAACRRIEAAVRGIPPTSTRVTAFDVEETIEEDLVVTSLSQPQAEPLPLPDGASVERYPAEPGVESSSSSRYSDGRARAEVVRRPRDGDSPTEPGSRLIRTTVVPVAIAESALDSKGWLLRWTAMSRVRRYGIGPAAGEITARPYDAAVLMTSARGSFDAAAVLDAVSRAVATLPLAGWNEAIAETLAATDLGTDEAILIRCGDPDAVPRAGDFCLGAACAAVLDPGPLCDGLAKRLAR